MGIYLLETWFWAELRKLITLTTGIKSNFYRTHLNKEVDFLLTRGFTHWGIECKAAASVSRNDCSGLEDMRAAIGSKAQGIIFYTGGYRPNAFRQYTSSAFYKISACFLIAYYQINMDNN